MNGKIFKAAKGADVASVAGAITLGDDGNYFDITGTNAITSITAKTAGTQVVLQFDSTASLVDGSNLKLAGNFQGAAESQIMLVSDGTNWFEVCRQPNTFTPTATNALAGSVVQVQSTKTGAVATGTTVIPMDDTIPQNTEGDQYLSQAITPSNASNTLLIIAVVNLSNNNTSCYDTIALFQDSTANALASSTEIANSSQAPICLTLFYSMAAGTTSATTFKIRAGADLAGTTTINGFNGARKHGGVLMSSLTIMEIKA